MNLKFLGRGSAFNTKEGNTSAYFIEDSTFFLIDCGENIFSRIEQKNLLDGIKEVYIFITHLHPDHVGSLGSLIFYGYAVKKIPINIVVGQATVYSYDLKEMLGFNGCTENMYKMVPEISLTKKFKSFNSVTYFYTSHCPEISACSIVFRTREGIVFYTGDTNDLGNLQTIMLSTSFNKIKAMYVDSTSLDYPGNVHLCIHRLAIHTPEIFRAKIYCMHFNDDKCIKLAKDYGFNVVEVEK